MMMFRFARGTVVATLLAAFTTTSILAIDNPKAEELPPTPISDPEASIDPDFMRIVEDTSNDTKFVVIAENKSDDLGFVVEGRDRSTDDEGILPLE